MPIGSGLECWCHCVFGRVRQWRASSTRDRLLVQTQLLPPMSHKNPEEARAYHREYSRKWRAENPDRVRAIGRKSYHKDRERTRELANAARRTRAESDPAVFYAKEREQNKKKRRERLLYTRFRLRPEQWEVLFDNQGRCCGRCGTDSPGMAKYWSTDHDHVTGRVRGILCHSCNTLLGRQGDTIDGVRASAALSIAYLERCK